MTPVLLDTGCIVALLDASEEHHAACAGVVASLDGPLVTCEAVIAESCYLLRDIEGAQEAILENVERGVFHVPLRLNECAASVARLMSRYRDVSMSFADACLVHLGEALRTGRILTLDSDFRVYRWGRNRPFELLVDP